MFRFKSLHPMEPKVLDSGGILDLSVFVMFENTNLIPSGDESTIICLTMANGQLGVFVSRNV